MLSLLTSWLPGFVDAAVKEGVITAAREAYNKANARNWQADLVHELRKGLTRELERLRVHYRVEQIEIDQDAFNRSLPENLSSTLLSLNDDQKLREFASRLVSYGAIIVGGERLRDDDVIDVVTVLLRITRGGLLSLFDQDEKKAHQAMLEVQLDTHEVAASTAKAVQALQPTVEDIHVQVNRLAPAPIFELLDRRRTTLGQRINQLPITNEFVGREQALEVSQRALSSGTQVILVSGRPGIGKTRFAFGLADHLLARGIFQSDEILVLRDVRSELEDYVRRELFTDHPYLVIIDDAQLDWDLSQLAVWMDGPNWHPRSCLVVTVRSYASDRIRLELGKRQARIELIELDNPPQEDRQLILQNLGVDIGVARQLAAAKGLSIRDQIAASQAVEINATGQVNAQASLQQYYSAVYATQSAQLGEEALKLLSVLAALRVARVDTEEFCRKLTASLVAADPIVVRSMLAKLRDAEFVDLTSDGAYGRLVNDSLGEYIVYRRYFRDTPPHGDFQKEVFAPFGDQHPRSISDVLIGLKTHGYADSPALTAAIRSLVETELQVLGKRSSQPEQIATALNTLKYFVQLAPDEICTATIRHATYAESGDSRWAVAVAAVMVAAMRVKPDTCLEPGLKAVVGWALTDEGELGREASVRVSHFCRYHAQFDSDRKVSIDFAAARLIVDFVKDHIATPLDSVHRAQACHWLLELCHPWVRIPRTDSKNPEISWTQVACFRPDPFALGILKDVLDILAAALQDRDIGESFKITAVRALRGLDRELVINPARQYDATISVPWHALIVQSLGPLSGTEPNLGVRSAWLHLWRQYAEDWGVHEATPYITQFSSDELLVFRLVAGDLGPQDRKALGLGDEATPDEYYERAWQRILPPDGASNMLSIVEALLPIAEGLKTLGGSAYVHHFPPFLQFLVRSDVVVARALLEEVSQPTHPALGWTSYLLLDVRRLDQSEFARIRDAWCTDGSSERRRALAWSLMAYTISSSDNVDAIEKLSGLGDVEMERPLAKAAIHHLGLQPDRMTDVIVKIAESGTPESYAELVRELVIQIYHSPSRDFQPFIGSIALRRILAVANGQEHLSLNRSIGADLCQLLVAASDANAAWIIGYLKARVTALAAARRLDVEGLYAFGPDADIQSLRQHPEYAVILDTILTGIQDAGRDWTHFLWESIATAILRGEDRYSNKAYAFDAPTLSFLQRAIHASAARASSVIEVLEDADIMKYAGPLLSDIVTLHPSLATPERLFEWFDDRSWSGESIDRLKTTKQRLEQLQGGVPSKALASLCEEAITIAQERIRFEETREAIRRELRDWGIGSEGAYILV